MFGNNNPESLWNTYVGSKNIQNIGIIKHQTWKVSESECEKFVKNWESWSEKHKIRISKSQPNQTHMKFRKITKEVQSSSVSGWNWRHLAEAKHLA